MTFGAPPRPTDVGILAMEMYFPSRCVSEEALETFDGVSKGKYTIGLGQQFMAFTDDREDIYSFALNAVSGLMKKYNIDPRSIGRLEVGTETLHDKSKSVKSVLMDLFTASGNYDIEGIDNKNACYGSTAALFNIINWIESSSWDGRNGIVVAGDIAVYARGNARAVGGAGACAMLIGPNAPIVVEPIHGSYMDNVWDFYKPCLASEYPEVDGPLTITTYLRALESSYASFKAKLRNSRYSLTRSDGPISVFNFDYSILHCPYVKLVQKGYGRMVYHDFLESPSSPLFSSIPVPLRDQLLNTSIATSLTDKPTEKLFLDISKDMFQKRVSPSMLCARQLGNLYTGSLYAGLASLVSSVESKDLVGKRISMFAFGGGAAASFFAIMVKGDIEVIRERLDLKNRLDAMKVTSCDEYQAAMELRERNHNRPGLAPEGSLENIWPGTFYLNGIDERYRRSHKRLN